MTQKTRLHHLRFSALAVPAWPTCAVLKVLLPVAELLFSILPFSALRDARFALANPGLDMTLSGRTARPQPNYFGS